MVSVKTKGLKIDFVRDCIAESTAYFIIIILIFIMTPIIEIKISEKKTIPYLVLERRFLHSVKYDSKQGKINSRKVNFLTVSLHCSRIQNDHRELSRSKIQKRVRIWQMKTKWSSHRPPASVSNI